MSMEIHWLNLRHIFPHARFNGNMNPMQTNSSASYDQVTAGPVSYDAQLGSRQNDDAINDRPNDN